MDFDIVNFAFVLRYILFAKELFDRNFKKGKPFPLQAWTGPEGSRGLRLPDFKTIST